MESPRFLLQKTKKCVAAELLIFHPSNEKYITYEIDDAFVLTNEVGQEREESFTNEESQVIGNTQISSVVG